MPSKLCHEDPDDLVLVERPDLSASVAVPHPPVRVRADQVYDGRDWCRWEGGIYGLYAAARTWTDGQLAEALKRFEKPPGLPAEADGIRGEQNRREKVAAGELAPIPPLSDEEQAAAAKRRQAARKGAATGKAKARKKASGKPSGEDGQTLRVCARCGKAAAGLDERCRCLGCVVARGEEPPEQDTDHLGEHDLFHPGPSCARSRRRRAWPTWWTTRTRPTARGRCSPGAWTRWPTCWRRSGRRSPAGRSARALYAAVRGTPGVSAPQVKKFCAELGDYLAEQAEADGGGT